MLDIRIIGFRGDLPAANRKSTIDNRGLCFAANLTCANIHVKSTVYKPGKAENKTIATYYTIKTSTQQEFFE